MFKANGSNNFGINSGFARAMILLQGAANDAKPYGTGAWNGLSSSIEYMGSAAKWFVNGGTPYFMNFGLALIEGLAIILNVQTDCDTDEYTGRVAITHSFPGSNVNDVETLLVLHKDKSAGAPADKYDIHSYFAEGKLKNIPLSPEDLPTRFSKQWAAIQEWRNAAPHTDDADADEEPNDADADGAADDGDEVDYDDDMAALWNTTDNDRWSDLNDAQGETKRYHIHGNTNTGPVPMDHETAESSVPTGAAIVDTGAETVRT
jgi:hypothetical protein